MLSCTPSPLSPPTPHSPNNVLSDAPGSKWTPQIPLFSHRLKSALMEGIFAFSMDAHGPMADPWAGLWADPWADLWAGPWAGPWADPWASFRVSGACSQFHCSLLPRRLQLRCAPDQAEPTGHPPFPEGTIREPGAQSGVPGPHFSCTHGASSSRSLATQQPPKSGSGSRP